MLTALAVALCSANILHRDISFGNIIIFLDEEGNFKKGLLIDWDLCKDVRKMGARQRDRTVSNSGKRMLGGASDVWPGHMAVHVCGSPLRCQQAAHNQR